VLIKESNITFVWKQSNEYYHKSKHSYGDNSHKYFVTKPQSHSFSYIFDILDLLICLDKVFVLFVVNLIDNLGVFCKSSGQTLSNLLHSFRHAYHLLFNFRFLDLDFLLLAIKINDSEWFKEIIYPFFPAFGLILKLLLFFLNF